MMEPSRMMTFPLRAWWQGPSQDPAPSLALVRITVALLLLVHPLYAMTHPQDLQSLAQVLSAHHLPAGPALAWVVVVTQVACSLALLVGRLLPWACAGHGLILAVGIALVHAPYWYAVGGGATDGHPGAEYSVLLLAGLGAVLWAEVRKGADPARAERAGHQAFQALRTVAGLILLAHPLHGVVDPSGMRQFGLGMEKLGFPMGVPLVWSVILLQILSVLGLLTRRLVVPAALWLLFVNAMGVWISHAPRWFVVGPGEEGMEYSLLLMACWIAVLRVHWPRRGAAAPQAA